MEESCPFSFAEQVVVHLAREFFVCFVDASALEHQVEGCAFFVGECIGAEVCDGQAKCLLEVVLPMLEGLVGQAVYEVDADVVDARLMGCFHCLCDLTCGVSAVDESEGIVVEGLCSDADAVDGCSFDAFEPLGVYVVGVGFYGDFSVVGKRVVLADGLEEVVQQWYGQ